jgi:hypothetical protein
MKHLPRSNLLPLLKTLQGDDGEYRSYCISKYKSRTLRFRPQCTYTAYIHVYGPPTPFSSSVAVLQIACAKVSVPSCQEIRCTYQRLLSVHQVNCNTANQQHCRSAAPTCSHCQSHTKFPYETNYPGCKNELHASGSNKMYKELLTLLLQLMAASLNPKPP